MAINVKIAGKIVGSGAIAEAHLLEVDGEVGPIVYTKDRTDKTSTGRPFLNDTFGSALNQNVSFSGTPENINNGGDSAGWTGTAVAGTWDFTAAGVGVGGSAATTLTNGDNADSASFADATETDMSNFTAITGQINLVAYADLSNDLTVEFFNNGVLVGNSVDLDDFINTGLIGTFQGFVIPKDDMALNGFTIDEFVITLNRNGGAKPTIYFDNIQIEESGSPLVYRAEARSGTRYLINRIVYAWADVGTGGTAYAYNKIGALASLVNGLVLTVTVAGEVIFSSTLKDLSDFVLTGATVENHVDDGTNTFVSVALPTLSQGGVILDSTTNDCIALTVNDDLSGLLEFTAFTSGLEEDL